MMQRQRGHPDPLPAVRSGQMELRDPAPGPAVAAPAVLEMRGVREELLDDVPAAEETEADSTADRRS